MDVSKISDHIKIKIKMANPSQEPPASSKAPNKDPKGHGCSLNLQNQDKGLRFGIWVYQKSVTISKSKWRCQISVRDLQHLLELLISHKAIVSLVVLAQLLIKGPPSEVQTLHDVLTEYHTAILLQEWLVLIDCLHLLDCRKHLALSRLQEA